MRTCSVVSGGGISVLNYLPNFQFRNSLYYSLISKPFLPFRFSCLILFKHFSFPLWILLLRNTCHIIERQKMDKLTLLRNTMLFNLVDLNQLNYIMLYARRLESEYTHTHTLLENIPSATEEGLQKKVRLPSSMLMLILWKANYLTFPTETLQPHLTTAESSSFFCKFTSYVWVILFTKMSSCISLIKNKIGRVRDGKKIQCQEQISGSSVIKVLGRCNSWRLEGKKLGPYNVYVRQYQWPQWMFKTEKPETLKE